MARDNTPSALEGLCNASEPHAFATVIQTLKPDQPTMTRETKDRDHFENLRHRIRTAVGRRELQHALAICDEAYRWAEGQGSQTDLDFVRCSRNAVLLHMGHGDSVVRELQMILMRSSDPLNRHMASYNLSFFYELREDFEKSGFYAKLALDHATQTDLDYYRARSYSRVGNLSIRKSQFNEALESYNRAWELFVDEQLYERLAVLTSMGYCHLACGRIAEGFENLFTVRRSYIRLKMGCGMALGRLRLSFCFGYLELEKCHQASLHGIAGMKIGEQCGDHELVKKALYLLGEAEKLRGDDMAAFTYFAKLQEEYYPDNPFLPDLLLDNDTKQLVNLWA